MQPVPDLQLKVDSKHRHTDPEAQNKEELPAADHSNIHYMQTIEHAAFSVHLDDSTPTSFSDMAKQWEQGDDFNSWLDKPVQSIIGGNGESRCHR